MQVFSCIVENRFGNYDLAYKIRVFNLIGIFFSFPFCPLADGCGLMPKGSVVNPFLVMFTSRFLKWDSLILFAYQKSNGNIQSIDSFLLSK
jgi:hypothetical protein